LNGALVSTNGVVPGWSADRKQSTSAVTTTVNSLLSNAPPFLPFFCIGPKLRFIRSTPIASESMSQNDLKCFANTGVNSLQTPCRAHEYAISTSHPVRAVALRVAQAD